MYGDKPYVYHLEKVYDNAVYYSGNYTIDDVELETARDRYDAAWLHDVVEDTDATVDDVRNLFGDNVANVVDLVTNVIGQDGKVDKEATFTRIRTNSDAVFIKLCDRLANVQAGEKNDMYRKIHHKFKTTLYQEREYDILWDAIDDILFHGKR